MSREISGSFQETQLVACQALLDVLREKERMAAVEGGCSNLLLSV